MRKSTPAQRRPLTRRAPLRRAPFSRALAASAAVLALAGSSLVLAAPASAHSTHHGSSQGAAPRLSFAFLQNGVRSGDNPFGTTSVGLVISASKASSSAKSVRVRTFGGDAEPGQYEATDARVTIPAGKTSVGFRIPVTGIGEDDPATHFYVGLSSPSSGAKLGLLRIARVTIYPWPGPPPLGGFTDRSQDFESGVPDEVVPFSSRAAVRPTLDTAYGQVPGNVRENRALEVRVATTPRATDWLGFREQQTSVDLEPSAVGPTVWFKGRASGGTVTIVLRNGSRVFEYPVTDDSTGWRHLEPAFGDFTLRGDPTGSERFDPDDYRGYEIRLTRVTPGRYLFDDPSVVYVF